MLSEDQVIRETVELIEDLTRLATAAIREAARKVEAGDGPRLARLEVQDLVDPFMEGIDPPLRDACDRHLAAILEASFAAKSQGEGA